MYCIYIHTDIYRYSITVYIYIHIVYRDISERTLGLFRSYLLILAQA